MENRTGNYFGTSIDTNEITDGAITVVKLATAASNALSSPIGSIAGWLKSYTNTPALPSGWVECAGQTLSDSGSVYNGQVIPNLNTGTQRFLRGSSTSGSTGGSDSHTHGITVQANTGGSGGQPTKPNTPTDAASTLPSYYEVVWIMRIK